MEKVREVSKARNLYLTVSILIPFSMSMICTFTNGSMAFVMAVVYETEQQWHVDEIMVGLALASYTLSMAISGLLAAYSLGKVSNKPVAIIGGLITGSGFILLGYAWTWEILYIAIILAGVGNGIVAPVIYALISDATPPEKRSTNYGLFFLFGLFGSIMVLVLFGQTFLNKIWRPPYIILGYWIIGLALLTIVAKLPSRGQKDRAIQELIEQEDVKYDYTINLGDFKDILKRKSNQWLILNFADAVPTGVIMFLVIWLVEEHHLQYSAAMGLFVIVVCLSFLSPVFWGRYADKLYEKTKDDNIKIKICIVLLLVSSPLGIIAVFIPWDASGITDPFSIFLIPGFLIVFFLLIGLMVTSPGIRPIWQSLMTEINLPEHRTTSYQIAVFVDLLGVSFGVFMAGYLIVWFGYPAAFIFAGSMGLINVYTWTIALRYYKDDKLEVETILTQRAEKMKAKKKE